MAFPGTYNFNYYKGDTFEMIVRPKNSDGTAIDLTDFDSDFIIANKRGSTGTQYEAQANVEVGNDLIRCTILPDTLRDVTAGTYVYDIQINNTENPTQIYTILTGTITMTDDIVGAVP